MGIFVFEDLFVDMVGKEINNKVIFLIDVIKGKK